MRKKMLLILLMVNSLGVCCASEKKDDFDIFLEKVQNHFENRISIGAKISTLGYGFEAFYKAKDWLSLRLNGQYLKYSHNIIFNANFTYSNAKNVVPASIYGTIRLMSLGLLADLHPFKNGFAISLGLLNNQNEINVKAGLGSDSITITNSSGRTATFSSSFIGSATVDVTVNRFSPFFGLRYDSGYVKTYGWSFNCEAGAIYHGTPKVKVNYTGTAVGIAVSAILNKEKYTGTLQQYVDDQVNKIKKYVQVWPVLGFGVSYKF